MLVALLLTRAFAASPALFGAPVMITPLGMSGTDVKTGDVNGDGLLDVTVAAGDSYGWTSAGRGWSCWGPALRSIARSSRICAVCRKSLRSARRANCTSAMVARTSPWM